MKIGTFLSFESVPQIEEKLKMLKEYGFDNCQLASSPESGLWTEENAGILNDLLKKYGVTVTAFWCGCEGPAVWDFYGGPRTLGLVPQEYRSARIQNICDGADFAKKLGITDVVSHMGFIPEDPNAPNFAAFCAGVRAVAVHLQQNGQYLLFETGQETPVTMLRCFEQVGCGNLGVNLDTANLILYGKANPVDALDVFGKYVRGLHAKDGFYPTNGHELGKEVRIGTGKVDFRGVIAGLHALGYDGPITIEREIEGEQQLTDILESRKYLQTLIDALCC